MAWTVALDLLMATLLAACIITTFVLNRRLANLRSDSAGLEKLASEFREATDRADHGVSGLKVSTATLQERLDAARTLADDLQFLIERGGSLADRLESEIRAGRRADGRSQPASPAAPAETAGRSKKAQASHAAARSAAELHLLAAMRAHG